MKQKARLSLLGKSWENSFGTTEVISVSEIYSLVVVSIISKSSDEWKAFLPEQGSIHT